MKKAVSRTLIIVGSVVLALAIVVLVLSLVKNTPMDVMDGYTRVDVYNLSSTDRIEVEASSDNNKTFKAGMDKASYSIMQGILEGKASGKMEFKTEVKDGETDKSRVETESADIAKIASTDSLYKLVFYYNEVKTVTVEGEEIKFDRAVMLLGDSKNEIQTVEVVFYLDSRVDNESDDEEISSENYTVNTVLVRGRTTDFYNAVADIIANR